MRPATLKFLLLGCGVVAGSMTILHRWQTTTALRNQVATWRQQNRDLSSIAAEHERLANLTLSTNALEVLRAEAAEAAALQDEIAKLRQAAEANSLTTDDPATPPATESALVPKQWINAGRATPVATFESVLWSALNGDTDELARMIAFDPVGRARIEALFARLPETMRQENDSAEKAFATLLAARLPQDLASATVRSELSQSGDTVVLQMHLQHVDGREKDAGFSFTRSRDGWQLVVPPAVVENYQQMLANAGSPRP